MNSPIDPKVREALEAAQLQHTAAMEAGRLQEAEEGRLRAEREAERRRILRERLATLIATAKLVGRLAVTQGVKPSTSVGESSMRGFGIGRRSIFRPEIEGWSVAQWTVDTVPHSYREHIGGGPDYRSGGYTVKKYGPTPAYRHVIISCAEGNALYLVDTVNHGHLDPYQRDQHLAAGLPIPGQYETLPRNLSTLEERYGNAVQLTDRTPVELLDGTSAQQLEAALLGFVALHRLRAP